MDRSQTTEHLKEIIETQSMLAMAGFDLQGFMNTVVERMQLLTPATGAVVELVDGEEMVYKAASGSVAPYIDLRLPLGNSLTGLCVRDRELKICNDTKTDPRVNYEACLRVGAVSMVCVPLSRAGETVGVLKVVSTETNAFSAEDIATLQLMAGLLGNALGQQLEMEYRRKLEDALRHRTQELESRNEQLVHVLAELEEQSKQLEERNQQVQETTRLKSEFLANMSHEIRTPMNAVVGFTDILLRNITVEKHREYLTLIREAGRALISLIGDILDFSKIEAGKLTIEYINFDPVQVVEGTAELLVGQCQAKGLSLLTYIDPTIPRTVTGDPGRIRQILINLIGNAIKFSSAGSVVVKVIREGTGDSVRFTIADQGMGMTEEEIARLFRPFVQADGSTTRKFGGTGLGLSICKRLVELMGGEISVTSTKGQGSTFTFVLPMPAVQTTVAQPEQARNELVSSKHVLIVDDDRISREIIAAYLTGWGVRHTSAANSAEALEQLRRGDVSFDIVLTDLVMPEMSGMELAKEIQKDQKLAPIPVLLMMSALDQAGQGETAVKEGFRGYLRKPIKQSQLFDAVSGLLTGMDGDFGIRETASQTVELAQNSARTIFEGGLVLLAEDNLANQMVAELQLNELGLSTQVVSNGREAVQAAMTNEFRAILMDCQMPEMDGFEATRQIRRQEVATGRRVPIIAMTAHAMQGDREACIAAGMDDYVTKPVELDELRRILGCWLTFQKDAVSTSEQNNSAPARIEEPFEAAIDLASLETMFGLKALRKLLKVFQVETEQSMIILEMALENHEEATIQAAAHKLRGSCATMRAQKMAILSSQLELNARSQDWESLAKWGAELKAEHACVQNEVFVFMNQEP